MIQRYKTKDAAKILCVEEHLMKNLREHGFLIGAKSGHGYVFDSEEMDMFIRMTRGYDISNPSKIAIAAQIIQPQKKMLHPDARM